MSFAADVFPILNNNCGGCHTGTGTTAGLGLGSTPASSFAELGTLSVDVPTMLYVTPFQPENSYVFHKIAGTHLDVPGGAGSRMPRGRAPLSAEDETTIRTWILEGASEN